jgi:hypothetical protein
MFSTKQLIFLWGSIGVSLGFLGLITYLKAPKTPMEQCRKEFEKLSGEQTQTINIVAKLSGHKNIEGFIKDYCESAIKKGEYK